jgi:hypothetical protein
VPIVFAAVLGHATLSDARPTQRCNTGDSSIVLLSGLAPDAVTRLTAIPIDASLYKALWEPVSRRAPFTSFSRTYLEYAYDPFQDVNEIAAALRVDPVVSPLAERIDAEGAICSLPPPPLHDTITEWHNTILDHYFLSGTEAENAIIASGGAGPGWERTGQTFRAIPPDACYGVKRVFRFYTPGARSHFFTVDPDECGGLRTSDSGWIAEGIAFGATMPVNGACTRLTETPVYRLYNNRWMYGDSNHRYTTDAQVYQSMLTRGWIGEGVTLCVRQGQ